MKSALSFVPGATFRTNHDLYLAVRREREKLGLPVANLNIQLSDHPMLGKKMKRKDGNVYLVEDVRQHWYEGWYEALLIQHNGSHCLVFWKSLTCRNEIILEGIDEVHEEYVILP